MTRAPHIVAIDGPAGAGKSSAALALAQRLNFCLVDTGAIYRTVALLAARAEIAFDDEARVAPLLMGLALRFELRGGRNHVFLGTEDISSLIRTPELSMGASAVSALPTVRSGLLQLQRDLAHAAKQAGAVLEGRDIGTVVFPEADLKIFLTASPEARATRRYAELQARGLEGSFDEVLQEQKRRDAQDTGRKVAPLVAASDAVVVDSSERSLEEVVAMLFQLAQEHLL